ncbi:hypothetical protein OKW40_001816 [Paraburkholderia sp. RAU6.4a]
MSLTPDPHFSSAIHGACFGALAVSRLTFNTVVSVVIQNGKTPGDRLRVSGGAASGSTAASIAIFFARILQDQRLESLLA